PLSDAERGPVKPRRARLERRERARDREPAVAVPVPVDLHVDAERLDHLVLDERDQLVRSGRRRVSDRVAVTDARRAASDRPRGAPLRIACVTGLWVASSFARRGSSVAYRSETPSATQTRTDSSVGGSNWSLPQPSVWRRISLEPMNTHASIGTPTD